MKMDSDYVTYSQPRDAIHGEQKTLKANALHSLNFPSRLEEIQDYEGEQNSWSSTPSMTNGSSRSNSSSIVTCERTVSRRATSTTETSETIVIDRGGREMLILEFASRWVGSPQSSPALRARHLKGSLPSQVSRCRLDGPLYSTPKPAGQASVNSPLGIESYYDPHSIHSTAPSNLTLINSKLSSTQVSKGTSPHHEHKNTQTSMEPLEHPASDSEVEEDEDSTDENESDDEDDNWSGQDGILEALVLKAVGNDLPLAAHLIPILHKSLGSKTALTTTARLGSWRLTVKSTNGGEGVTDPGSAVPLANGSSNPRKRQRRPGGSGNQGRNPNDLNDDEDDDDDDNQEPRDMENDPSSDGQLPLPRLACPFYKRDPSKYSTQHGVSEGLKKTEYRICEGPGFKNIQRLKEHLKRKHFPVQCVRCHRIFPGSDRAACLRELENHTLATPCQVREASGIDGISVSQWARLDLKKSPKKNQAQSKDMVTAWFEYWVVLFPDVPQPETPWYDHKIPSRTPQHASEDALRFAEFFQSMLQLKVSQQHIRFLEGQEDVMRTRMERLVYQAFNIYLGMNGTPSTSTSSSSISRPQPSLLDGSYQQISPSESRSTAAYSMDIAASPTAASTIRRSRSHQPTTMAPPFMAVPRMPSRNFANNNHQSPMSIEQSPQGDYHQAMADHDLTGFVVPYTSNGLGTGEMQWDNMQFSNVDAAFYGDPAASTLNNSGYTGSTRGPLNQTLNSANETSRSLAVLNNFDQYQHLRNVGYNGPQQ